MMASRPFHRTFDRLPRAFITIFMSTILIVAFGLSGAIARDDTLASEDFEGPNAWNWGHTAQGQSWSYPTGSGHSWQAHGEGVMRMARDAWRGNTLNVRTRDTGIQFDVRLDDLAGGMGTKLVTDVRKGSQGSYVGVVRVSGNGRVWLAVGSRTSHLGDITNLGSSEPVDGWTASAGESISVRFEAIGSELTQLRIKAWPADTREPGSWTLVRNRRSSRHAVAGRVGIGGDIAPAASGSPRTVTVRFDDIRMMDVGGSHFAPVTPDRVQDDTSKPSISAIKASDITRTAATIRWLTDEPATSNVRYGWGDPNHKVSGTDQRLVSSHSVRLAGLKPGRTYQYKVVSKDKAGNVKYSGTMSFRTIGGDVAPTPDPTTKPTPEPSPTPTPDTTAPVLSDIGPNSVTENSAQLGWSANEMADGVLEWGLSTDYTQYYSADPRDYPFAFNLLGLSSGTEYFYQVSSTDLAGNTTTEGPFSFTTLGGEPDPSPGPDPEPQVLDIEVSHGSSDATIRLYASETVTGYIDYGRFTTYGTRRDEDDPDTMLEFYLEGLDPGTEYHWRYEVKDLSGQTNSDYQDHTFTTDPAPNPSPSASPDLIPPAITAVRLSGLDHDSVVIGWDTDEETFGWIYYGLTSKYTDHTDENTNYGPGGSREISGLDPGTTYHYSVWVSDHSGNTTWSDDATFTTLAAADA